MAKAKTKTPVKKQVLRYRMYGLVPYNISEIQKGIQFGHGVVEYSNLYGEDADYKRWSQHDKTFIILNGGTTNNGKIHNRRLGAKHPVDFGEMVGHYVGARGSSMDGLGSMQRAYINLDVAGIKFAYFQEPDLNNAVTAIVFLADERVWDRERYPDVDDSLNSPTDADRQAWAKWVGPPNVFLREFLSKFKLA